MEPFEDKLRNIAMGAEQQQASELDWKLFVAQRNRKKRKNKMIIWFSIAGFLFLIGIITLSYEFNKTNLKPELMIEVSKRLKGKADIIPSKLSKNNSITEKRKSKLIDEDIDKARKSFPNSKTDKNINRENSINRKGKISLTANFNSTTRNSSSENNYNDSSISTVIDDNINTIDISLLHYAEKLVTRELNTFLVLDNLSQKKPGLMHKPEAIPLNPATINAPIKIREHNLTSDCQFSFALGTSIIREALISDEIALQYQILFKKNINNLLKIRAGLELQRTAFSSPVITTELGFRSIESPVVNYKFLKAISESNYINAELGIEIGSLKQNKINPYFAMSYNLQKEVHNEFEYEFKGEDTKASSEYVLEKNINLIFQPHQLKLEAGITYSTRLGTFYLNANKNFDLLKSIKRPSVLLKINAGFGYNL
jgi:hypothetical protein